MGVKMSPDQVAAELNVRNPGWRVFYGRYSRQFIALPLVVGGIVTAGTAVELETRLERVRAAHPGVVWVDGSHPGTGRAPG